MDIFAAETAPFAVALGVTLVIAILEFVGLLMGAQPSAVVDGALPEFDIDADLEPGSLAHVLSWLNFGKLPALVVLVLLLSSFGLIGIAGQELVRRSFGMLLNPWVASAPAAIGAVVLTRFAGAGIARIMPREETDAVSTETFIGRIATVFRGVAIAGHPAEAKLTDIHGRTHYVLVMPDAGEAAMPEGSQVLLVRQEGAFYRAISTLKPAT